MKILLIIPRYELAIEAGNFNYGIGYICSVLRQAGHTVSVLNTDPAFIDYSGIAKRIREADCDLIGLGGLSIAFSFIEWAMKFIRKERPEIPIILGGGILTAAPDLIFDHFQPDYGVLGEGEETIVELVNAIDSGAGVGLVPGLILWCGKTSKRKPIEDLDSLPWPAWDDLNMEAYIQTTAAADKDMGIRRMPILASRSCPFLCNFCFHTTGNKYRKRSPQNVIDEMIEVIRKYQVNYFAVADELFIYDLKWVETFCKRLIELSLFIKWECNGKVNYGNPEIYSLMKEAGCVNIAMGLESGNDMILKELGKGFKAVEAKQTIRTIRKAGLGASGGLILGSTSETKETWQNSIDFIKDMEIPLTWINFITPYPGTKIYKEAVSRGLITDELEFHRKVWNTQGLLVNFTQMTDEELIELKENGLEELHKHLIEKSRGDVLSSISVGETKSMLKMRCRQCGKKTIHRCTDVNVQLTIFICPRCYFARLIDPYSIPHVREKIDRFAQRVSELDGSILITPVGEHTRRLLSYTNWRDKDILGFMDGDQARTKHEFLGHEVFHRTPDTAKKADWILVTAKEILAKAIIRELNGYTNIISLED